MLSSHFPLTLPTLLLCTGVNYTRTACVIAVSKARDLFEPFLHQLGYRLAHVQRRMLPIAMHLLQVRGRAGLRAGGGGALASLRWLHGRPEQQLARQELLWLYPGLALPEGALLLPLGTAASPQKDGQFLNGHDLFLKRVGAAYHAFIDEFEKACRCGRLVGRDVARAQKQPMEWCVLTDVVAVHALAPGCHLPASKPAAPHRHPSPLPAAGTSAWRTCSPPRAT